MSSLKTRLFLAGVCATALVLAGCDPKSGSDNDRTPAPAPPTGTEEPPPQTRGALPEWLGFNAALVVQCGQNIRQDSVRHYRLNQNGAQTTTRADLANSEVIWYDGPRRTVGANGCYIVLGANPSTAIYVLNPVPDRQNLWTLQKLTVPGDNTPGADNDQMAIVLVWSTSDYFFRLPAKDGYITGVPPNLK